MRAEGMIVAESVLAPPDIMYRFRTKVEAMGMRVFCEIDFAADAARADLERDPVLLLVFGNPHLGTLLLQEKPSVGIDLPLKALAWTVEGRHWLGYANIRSALARNHGLANAHVIEKMSEAQKTAAGVALA